MTNEDLNSSLIMVLKGLLATPSGVEIAQQTLATTLMPWSRDASMPPNYQRKTALGDVIATVDRRLGGYQWPHHPRLVGYKVWAGNAYNTAATSGILHTRNDNTEPTDEDVEDVLARAKAECDAALATLFTKHGWVDLADTKDPVKEAV